ncbi:unnamed protein product [Parnassius mnemosyne]|uniref:Pericentrin/AKAP-450 centrosomal targeting domain-containing protein n=1 Tax=Parnassius mnemosyne TaxID=213953 RepID=A0AAV1KZ00_9NEOP
MGLPDLTEVRLERDVVHARMSEQALRVSTLSAQLARQRHAADALAHAAASDLGVQLHDATAEVQRLKEELESKDKQLARLKQNLEEKSKSEEQQHDAHGDANRVEEKVKVVERSLCSAQQRCAQLQAQLDALAADNKQLRAALLQRDRQLQDLVALKLEDDDQNQKSEPADGKASGRTLSDIVSISEFDEQDLQMRRAELKGQNISLTGAPYVTETRDKSQLNRTLPPDLQRPNMSSLNLDCGEHFDVINFTPRADSLPIHLTSTQNRDGEYKRNTNETTVFGKAERSVDTERHSPQNIPDNCSLYPNRDISDSKNVSVEPKKINFSLEASDNKTQDEDFTSLRELGISLDMRQENFPDILTQLKHELKKTRNELESCKSELKNAEEQLCEFPALKEEVEELKGLLENTMATMENDKKFYENQLENFSSNKKLLEQRLAELTQEVSDKTKDLHLLKEDILRRENMILELAKEKRNLTNKLTELEVKIDELQSRNETLGKFETETHQLREKIKELEKLDQLVTEKNQQIDSLNQHLDRLDDLQRCLNDKTEEYDNLKEAFHEKSNELYQLQGTVDALNRDMNRISEENNELKNYNKELNLKLSKLEKEQENASLRLQNSENELERVNSMNSELTSKIEELKTINEKLKDKETEIEILNEDINSYHNEIASLKEQLKMVSRSPSPRSKNVEDRKTPDRQANNDRKQLAKIRKQISLLQHELDFNKKDLNDKAFELAKAKLDVTELRNNASQAAKQVSDKEAVNRELMKQTEALKQEIHQLVEEKRQLSEQLDIVVARMREESNVSEIKAKLREKAESCHELEMQLHEMRDMVDRRGAARSPTAELERALRDQLHYSHALDDHIMDQILSASSDEREDIPRLALNTSKSSSSIHSTSSDRVGRLRAENEKLQMQVENLESRLKDKDALITELNRIRDQLVQDWQTVKLRYEAERDNSGRLQLLLDSQKETSESLQNQDSNMIQILKKRLESAMQSELELQEREQTLRRRVAELESALPANGARESLRHEMESVYRLKSEISVLRSKLEAERGRSGEAQLQLQVLRLQLDQRAQCAAQLRAELADVKRLKHDAGVELARAKELLSIQSATIVELEKKLSSTTSKQRPLNDTLSSVEQHKSLASPRPSGLNAPDEKDQALRYLHGRCVRLESWRKALVWQKRYLQRVLAGYARLDRALQPHHHQPQLTGRRLFKCVALAAVAALRLRFLLRRRAHARSAAAVLCTDLNDNQNNLTNASLSVPRNNIISTPLACTRQLLGEGVRRLRPAHTPHPASPSITPRTPHAPHTPHNAYAPHTHLAHPSPLTPIVAFPSRAAGDDVRQSLCDVNSPRNEFFLRSPRGEIASAYLDKLDAVRNCLSHALHSPHHPPRAPHTPRDVP